MKPYHYLQSKLDLTYPYDNVWDTSTISEDTWSTITSSDTSGTSISFKPVSYTESTLEVNNKLNNNVHIDNVFKITFHIDSDIKVPSNFVHIMTDFANDYLTHQNKKIKNKILLSDQITDVEILQEDKAVRVTFGDGETEKAICDERDTFSLERAIEICICKHLIGGTSKFNKAVRDGLKVYEDKLQAIEDEKAEEERIEKKRQKHNAYRDRCRQKAEQAEKEKQIEIQKEAYLQAMKEFNGGKKTKKQK